MNKFQLDLIGKIVGGTYYGADSGEDDVYYIFSSHTLPAYRIEVSKTKAEKLFEDWAEIITNTAQAD